MAREEGGGGGKETEEGEMTWPLFKPFLKMLKEFGNTNKNPVQQLP